MTQENCFRPETEFVLTHWDDVALLRRALREAEADIGGVVGTVAIELKNTFTRGSTHSILQGIAGDLV